MRGDTPLIDLLRETQAEGESLFEAAKRVLVEEAVWITNSYNKAGKYIGVTGKTIYGWLGPAALPIKKQKAKKRVYTKGQSRWKCLVVGGKDESLS